MAATPAQSHALHVIHAESIHDLQMSEISRYNLKCVSAHLHCSVSIMIGQGNSCQHKLQRVITRPAHAQSRADNQGQCCE